MAVAIAASSKLINFCRQTPQNKSMRESFRLRFFTLLLSSSSSFALRQIWRMHAQICKLWNCFSHWSYGETVDVAFRHVGMQPTRWVAWAINPTGKSNGRLPIALNYCNHSTCLSLAGDELLQSGNSNLTFQVPNISVDLSNNQMVVYARQCIVLLKTWPRWATCDKKAMCVGTIISAWILSAATVSNQWLLWILRPGKLRQPKEESRVWIQAGSWNHKHG